MSAEPKWNFAPYTKGQMLQDPTQSEFFTTENVGSLTAALVRETIQNALDARKAPRAVVLVRFGFVRVEPANYRPYLDNLLAHLRVVFPERDLPDFDKSMRFLVIEDFNTGGLVGDWTADNDDHAKDNNFYYFWRNVGRSGKSDNKRGRWGLGKAVFYTVSTINTFFGITIPKGEQDMLLMGQAVLKSHRMDKRGETLTPYGYYGLFGARAPHFALPITDSRHTQTYCRTFDLYRDRLLPDGTPNTGLSVIVPAPNEEVTIPLLIRAAIDQYFYPILGGTLDVQIHDDTKDQLIRLKQNEIFAQLRSIPNVTDDERQHYERLFDFANWAIRLPVEEYVQLRPAPLDKAPTWSYDYLDEAAFAAAAQRFAETGRIAFLVPVKVQTKKGKPEVAGFKVFFERDESLKRAENYFIREGITITGIRTLTQARLRGMVVVDSKPLTTLLGDAENPAHTDWHKDSLKFKDKYEHGPTTISFVKNSLKQLASRLTEVKAELDKDLLRDVFALPVEEEAPRSKRKQARPQPTGEQETPDGGGSPEIHGHSAPVRLQPSGTGVLITGADLNGATPQRVTVEFAYDVRTGDPFKRHSAADFDLRADDSNSIHIDAQGAVPEAREVNRVTFAIHEADFRVHVTGFHPYRDLKVRLRWDGVDGEDAS